MAALGLGYLSWHTPSVAISATYPGASAQTLEDSVTQVIEQKMKGIDYMSSTSESSGQANITLAFKAGTDPDIAQVSQGVQDATSRSAEMSIVSGKIAQDIGLVDSITGEIRSGGEKVQASAHTLSALAAELRGLIERFKIKS